MAGDKTDISLQEFFHSCPERNASIIAVAKQAWLDNTSRCYLCPQGIKYNIMLNAREATVLTKAQYQVAEQDWHIQYLSFFVCFYDHANISFSALPLSWFNNNELLSACQSADEAALHLVHYLGTPPYALWRLSLKSQNISYVYPCPFHINITKVRSAFTWKFTPTIRYHSAGFVWQRVYATQNRPGSCHFDMYIVSMAVKMAMNGVFNELPVKYKLLNCAIRVLCLLAFKWQAWIKRCYHYQTETSVNLFIFSTLPLYRFFFMFLEYLSWP